MSADKVNDVLGRITSMDGVLQCMGNLGWERVKMATSLTIMLDGVTGDFAEALFRKDGQFVTVAVTQEFGFAVAFDGDLWGRTRAQIL